MPKIGDERIAKHKNITFHLGYLPEGLTLRAMETGPNGVAKRVLDEMPMNEDEGERPAAEFLKENGYGDVDLVWV
jgi:hypothetical protein